MKPIFLTEEEKAKVLEEFKEQLEKESLFDGTLKFERKWSYNSEEQEKAVMVYTPEAYLKTIQLIKEFSSEVAWHALCERADDGVFVVYDVLVYPQEVTGTTVNTDQDEYTRFLMDLTDEQANAMHVQCHSHVNMSTSPSGVDLNHQSQILQTLNSGFYIFQIWNKKLESTNVIYDIDNNIVFENKDIVVEVGTDECLMSDFIAESKEIVKERKAATIKSTKAITSPSNASDSSEKYKSWMRDEDDDYWTGKNYDEYGYYGGRYF